MFLADYFVILHGSGAAYAESYTQIGYLIMSGFNIGTPASSLCSGTPRESLIHKSEKCRRVAEVGGVLRGSAHGAKTAEVAGSMGKLRERIDIPSRLNSNFAVQAQAFTRQSRLSRRWRCLYCARLWHVPSGGAVVGLYGRGAQ